MLWTKAMTRLLSLGGSIMCAERTGAAFQHILGCIVAIEGHVVALEFVLEALDFQQIGWGQVHRLRLKMHAALQLSYMQSFDNANASGGFSLLLNRFGLLRRRWRLRGVVDRSRRLARAPGRGVHFGTSRPSNPLNILVVGCFSRNIPTKIGTVVLKGVSLRAGCFGVRFRILR